MACVARELAQINVARFRVGKDDPANATFMAALDRVNAMAEAADGFVWRLVGEGNDATDIEAVPGDPDFIVNISTWRDLAALEAFAYRQADHRAMLARRREWFDPLEPSLALWWVPAGHRPSVSEGLDRLALIAEQGDSAAAFRFGWARTPAGRALVDAGQLPLDPGLSSTP